MSIYNIAERNRNFTHGFPLPLRPLDILDLVDRMSLPAEAEEAIAVICGMDDAWLKWKDSRQKVKR